MITGLFLRHYKVYQGVCFTPVCSDYRNKYSVYIGNNGVGKSSILESLNTFFNNSYWNISKNSKKSQAFIAPVFLICKQTFMNEIYEDETLLDYVEFISDYFWNVTSEANSNMLSEEFTRFFKYRDYLKEQYNEDDYYFFILGIEYENKSKPNFITFNADLVSKLPNELKSFDLDSLVDVIRNYYSYVYIPINTAPSDILRIESREIQELMNSDILNQIDSILNDKKFESGRRNISVIDYLNHSLDDYIDSINDVIKKIDDDYEFKVEGGYKKNLTSNDVRKKILEAYFSIRTLKKDRKEIDDLSSGEQRIAIIDIATAFLTYSSNTNKRVIFAIDEPENSLHISKSFSQFERLEDLSIKHQIILTTHWYGSLPIANKGNLHYLEKDLKIKINTYDFSSYFENRKKLPQDIMIKSYFELTSSMLSSMRADKTNWIICEGSDDKMYLEYYLRDIKNLKIFNVGGCGNVIKLYKYLYVPCLEKDESEILQSKILCLVDTDPIVQSLEIDSETSTKNLKIVRMQLDNSDKVELKKLVPNGLHNPTEMEDCLEPAILFAAIKRVVETEGTQDQKNALLHFDFNDDIIVSRIKGEHCIFKPKTLDALNNKRILYNIFENNRLKYLISKTYIDICNHEKYSTKPQLFRLIEEYFQN